MPDRNPNMERQHGSLLAGVEKQCLVWLARRMPGWVGPDHLTLLALASMFLAGVSYAAAQWWPSGLLVVNVWLAVNWFGDSLDGTLARVRRQERPRYGFYVDHMADSFSVLFLLGGLALSGYMRPGVAFALLIIYLLLSINLYLAAYMKADSERYFRPAVFICDEYQSFTSVGEDDPSGDEKAFALTRQCRVIPIVATQSMSSLRSVLGTSEAWRALLQTLRTRIFLSLSDDASADIASKLCGQVARIKPSWTVTESAQQAQVSLLSGRAGGTKGSVGTSKSFREQREALFQPREFGLLPNCQAICLPYDGTNATSAVRVYLKPYYLPETMPY